MASEISGSGNDGVILIINTCRKDLALHAYEFVRPLVDSVREAGGKPVVIHYTEMTPGLATPRPSGTENRALVRGVVISGSALGDNQALKNRSALSWLARPTLPVLGICQGMTLLASVNGGGLLSLEEIGPYEVEVLKNDPILGPPRGLTVYELHSVAPTLPAGFSVLAENANGIQAIRMNGYPVWGMLFHPEVRHRYMINRFVELCRKDASKASKASNP